MALARAGPAWSRMIAALAGLVFVAMSLHLREILAQPNELAPLARFGCKAGLMVEG